MSENIKKIQMQTNFDGLIHLLADGLYSTSDIFLRELIQNGHDGIIRRQAKNERDYFGKIDVCYDSKESYISITDNGIGMDEKDIVNFLSVIGSTGTGTKRSELEKKFSDELIGQFGIGLLSAFLVASKVQVQTRKLGTTSAFEWTNSGSTECLLKQISRNEIGSSVKVFLRNEFTYLLDRKKLEEIIVRYCDFITVPITINGRGPVNNIFAPWDRDYSSAEAERDNYSAFVNRRFSDSALDVFPIKINYETPGNEHEYRADGVLYISDRHLAGVNMMGSLDIFVRKMLVKENDTTLLPSWAQFIHGVIDSPDLKPTAGRDNINQDSPAFHYIQEELGRIIVNRLSYLAISRPDKFQYINDWHHETLKGMAMVNQKFFDMVGNLLLFHTNQGDLSLKDYLPKNPFLEDRKIPIYYFSHYTSAAQYYRMADEKGLCVINAGLKYDEELLEIYGDKHPEIKLEKLNVLDKGILFDELNDDERKRFQPLEHIFAYCMNNKLMINSVVSTKSFVPKEVPVVIIESDDDKDDRELKTLFNNPVIRMNFGGAFKGLQRRMYAKPIQLTLNVNNILIQQLSNAENVLNEEDYHQIIMMLYNNALLYSHRLDEKCMNIIHDGIIKLMDAIIRKSTEYFELKKKMEEERRIQQNNMNHVVANLPKHIRLFMITPFDKKYCPLEKALRLVFEQEPFFFEIRLARDYYSENSLVKNVRSHLQNSHGFIAEISELNPNVMMEVGGVLLSDDDRPLFVLRTHEAAVNPKPADFGDKLEIKYDGNCQTPEEIAKEIRTIILHDGRISNGDLNKLLEKESESFLSRTLLENLGAPLKEEHIDSILKCFSTIEEFMNATEDKLKMTNINSHFLLYIKDEITKKIKGKYNG